MTSVRNFELRPILGLLQRARFLVVATLLVLAASPVYAQHSVTASWDRNSDAYTAGYRLYYGTASGNYQWSEDVGNQTRGTLSLSPGRYYFVVRGYTSSYQIGPPSSEATLTVGSGQGPAPTPAPTAAIQASLQSSSQARVQWQTTNATSATINGISVPVSGSTTMAISGSTTFTLIARNASGVTARASATVTVGGGGGGGGGNTSSPRAPLDVRASISGSRVTISWRPDPSGGQPTDYLIYAGTTSGGSQLVNGQSVGNQTSVSERMPNGTYYVRVRARNSAGTSPLSTQVMFRVGATLASPTGFAANWDGTNATLSWIASAADSAEQVPSLYVLEAGTGPGLANVAAVPLTSTAFSVNIPRGVYYTRVRAVNQHGDSDPTHDLVVAAPGTAPAPGNLTAAGTGSAVEFAWTPPASTEAPLGYVIEAGSGPGMSDIATVPVGSAMRFATNVPAGRYYVRVRAINNLGPGFHSNEVVVER